MHYTTYKTTFLKISKKQKKEDKDIDEDKDKDLDKEAEEEEQKKKKNKQKREEAPQLAKTNSIIKPYSTAPSLSIYIY